MALKPGQNVTLTRFKNNKPHGRHLTIHVNPDDMPCMEIYNEAEEDIETKP